MVNKMKTAINGYKTHKINSKQKLTETIEPKDIHSTADSKSGKKHRETEI